MNRLELLYKRLKQYSDFDAEVGNADTFLDTAEEIMIEKDPKSIPILLSYFDDATDYHWVFAIIAKKISHYDDIVFTRAIIETMPTMMKKAPDFLIGIFFLIWNDEKCSEIFLNHISECNTETTLTFLDRIEGQYPELIDDFKIIRQKISGH
jgi:hypothetical protein